MFNNNSYKKIVNIVLAVMLTINTFSTASQCQQISDSEATALAELVYKRAQEVWERATKEAKEKGITLTCKSIPEVEAIMDQYCPFNSSLPKIVDHNIRRIKNKEIGVIQRLCRSFRSFGKSVVYRYKNWRLQTRY